MVGGFVVGSRVVWVSYVGVGRTVVYGTVGGGWFEGGRILFLAGSWGVWVVWGG